MSKKFPEKKPDKKVNHQSNPELRRKNVYKEKQQERRTDFEKEQDELMIKRKL